VLDRGRIGLLLQRNGMSMNHDKLYRVRGEEGLLVKRRRDRKRALGTRTPILVGGPTPGALATGGNPENQNPTSSARYEQGTGRRQFTIRPWGRHLST
jgi:hypothetical protein